MITFLFFLTMSYILVCIKSFEKFSPPCSQCKWFQPHNNGNRDHGLCKLFKNFFYDKLETKVIYDFASHCRDNEYQCGNQGYFFESKRSFDILNKSFHFLKEVQQMDVLYELRDLEEQLQELQGLTCGEVNETHELEEIEKETTFLKRRIASLKN